MKKKSIISLILSVGIFASFIPQSLAAQNLNWSIDENEVIRPLEKEMYGINWEWNAGEFEHEDSVVYTKDEQGNIIKRPDFNDMWKDTMTFLRAGGASTQDYLWKQSLGDFSERKPQAMWGYQNGIVYSAIVDILKAYLEVTPDGKWMYTFNMKTDTKESALDVVEFLTGDGTVNYNGGENWAQRRIDLGLKDPIDVLCWEFGNEVDFSIMYDEREYVEWIRDWIPAVRAIDKDAKFCALASTSAHANGLGGLTDERRAILGRWENYHRYVLEEVGNDIDYLTFHYYYPVGFIRRADPVLDKIEEDILEITGEDRIKVIVTEHAVAPNNYNWNPDYLYDYYLPFTIWGATGEMEFYLRMMYRDLIYGTNNHSINGSSWCIMYVDENGKLQRSAVGEMLHLLNRYGVGDLLKSDLDTFSKDESSSVAGQVVRDKDGNLNILFTNRFESEPVNVTFKFANGNYKLKHVKRICGPEKGAVNIYRFTQIPTVKKVPVEYTEEEVNSNSAFFSYTFDPLSIYALQLEPTAAKVSEEEKALAEAKKYMAIGNGYANAYVNAKAVSVDAEYKGAKAYIAEDGSFLISSEMLKKIFGASLTWDDSGNVCTATIGSKNLVFNTADGTVKEAGMPAEGFVPARRVGDWTYFVLRNIATNLGYSINWDNRGFVVMGQGGITPDAVTCDTIYNAMIGG